MKINKLILIKNGGGKIVDECNTIDANYWKGLNNHQGRTGVLTIQENIPMLIHKDIGPGSSGNLGIEVLNNETASCLCARDYKGISRMGANAVIVKGFNTDADGDSCRGLKAQYQKNSASNFCRSGSYGATAVIAIDEQNKCIRKDGCVGTLMTDGNSPKHNNRIGEIIKGDDNTECIDAYNKKVMPNENIGTLTANGNTSSTHCGTFFINNDNIRIRKLTPKECWRLQGWDDESFDKAKNAGVSDSQLYKQSGNGVSVNISQVIGLRLKEIENEITQGKE